MLMFYQHVVPDYWHILLIGDLLDGGHICCNVIDDWSQNATEKAGVVVEQSDDKLLE